MTSYIPVWHRQSTGIGIPDKLLKGSWIIVVREEIGYTIFLCDLGIRTCYPIHITKCCEDT
jgi:hypothetical protein